MEQQHTTTTHTAGAWFHYQQLDVLRGLAILIVVLTHYINILPAFYNDSCKDQLWALKHTPLYILWSGGEAVIFFYVLSGFVSSLPFYTVSQKYFPFILKRICRIYLPYLTAVLFAICLKAAFYDGTIPELSMWFNRIWYDILTFGSVVRHIILIGGLHDEKLIPVLWYLVHLMRISLFFPFIMMLINRVHWGVSIGISYFISMVAFALCGRVNSIFGYPQDYTETLTIIPLFVVGALLAKHRSFFIQQLSRLPLIVRYLLVIIALLSYSSHSWLFSYTNIKGQDFIEQLFITLGIIIILVSALGSQRMAVSTLLKPLKELGKISYSLYLCHTLCIVTSIHILYHVLPFWAIMFVSATLMIPLSWLGWRFIEIPSNHLVPKLAFMLKSS